MATAVHTSIGSTIFVSATLPATYDQAGYAALSWTKIGEVTDLGEFGGTYNEVTHTPLETGIVEKFKGSVNYGTLNVQTGRDPDDAGQAILIAAFASYNAYAFKVVEQGGTVNYFAGRVMSNPLAVGNADQITGANYNVSISKPIVQVLA